MDVMARRKPMAGREQVMSHIKSGISAGTRDKIDNPEAEGVSTLEAHHHQRAYELMTPEERKLAYPERE
jgi:hypothetical protein